MRKEQFFREDYMVYKKKYFLYCNSFAAEIKNSKGIVKPLLNKEEDITK